MSYEGYEEYLCKMGHYFARDAYDFREDVVCPECGSPVEYRHSVDTTNGYDEEDPHTYPAALKEKGFEDKWSDDHYGNRYANKIVLYEPDSDQWKNL